MLDLFFVFVFLFLTKLNIFFQDNVNVDQAMKFLISKILEVSTRVQLDAHKLPSHNSASLSVVAEDGTDNTMRSAREQQKKDSCDC